MEDLVEIDEVPENSNSGNKPSDAKYVLEKNNQTEIKVEDDDGTDNDELESDKLGDDDDNLY